MAGDDQQDLPSFGDDEDDAYSLPTKVGAMPADIAAQLRAEGVLPRESSTPQPAALRDSSATPLPSFASEPSPDEVTNVYAELPSQEMIPTLPSPPPPPPVPARAAPKVVETPVAFAAPTTSHGPSKDEAAEIRAFGGHSRTRMLALLIGGMVAILVLAFVMALLSHRR